MKRGLIATTVLAGWLVFAASSAELGEVKAIYILPMAQAFDQYLANQLNAQGVFEVVTDPQRADAILSDEIGHRFERQLEELYPPPPPPKEVEKEQTEKEADADVSPEIVGDVEPVPASSFSRARGNLFLVGRESRRVLWSIFHQPRNSSTRELNAAARKIVSQLKEKLPTASQVSDTK